MRPHDWAFFVEFAAGVAAIVAVVLGALWLALALAVVAVAVALLARYWSRRHPSPFPHSLRWMLAAGVGFSFDRRLGPPFAFYARFEAV